MRKNKPPEALAMDILHRSNCRIKVGAVLVDSKGKIFSWGWNHAGHDGFGCHAEAHAVTRANPKRLEGSTIYVAGLRAKNGCYVPSRPCNDCERLLNLVGVTSMIWWDRDEWQST